MKWRRIVGRPCVGEEVKRDTLRAPRVDELFHHLRRAASKVSLFQKRGSVQRGPNKQRATVVRPEIEAASLVPSAYVHPPINGMERWTVESMTTPGLVYDVDPSDALGCNCPQSKRGVNCKHIIKVLKTKEPDLPDDLIVDHLRKTWGTEQGTIECMLQAMRQAHEPPQPPSPPGEAAVAASREKGRPRRTCGLPTTLDDFRVSLPRRVARNTGPPPAPARTPRADAPPEPCEHPVDPPEYHQLVRQLVQLRQDYPDWQGKAGATAAAADAIYQGIELWYRAHNTVSYWATRQLQRADEAACMRLDLADHIPPRKRQRIARYVGIPDRKRL